MNYLKHYILLIRKAEHRGWTKKTAECYVEEHHTFPQGIFGKNKRVVCLTAREHFIAHWLLFKALLKRYGGSDKRTQDMAYAFHQMSLGTSKREVYGAPSFVYARAKEVMAQKCREDNFGPSGDAHPFSLSNPNGQPHPTKGSRWYTNGVDSVRVMSGQTPPEGYVLGFNKETNFTTNNPSKKKRKQIKVTSPDGTVSVFDSVIEAASILGICPNALSRVARGKNKTCQGGYTATYTKVNNDI